MKAREGEPRPCRFCGRPTVFVLTLTGPRGGRRTLDCCPDCGENPHRRENPPQTEEEVAA